MNWAAHWNGRAVLYLTLAVTNALTGCAQPAAAPTALVEIIAMPAEKALMAGLRAYEDAQYAEAQQHFNLALSLRLTSPKDRAAAHKYLAFIYCTSHRQSECEAQFRAARLADPAFTLDKSEAGHPSWGEVYKRVRP